MLVREIIKSRDPCTCLREYVTRYGSGKACKKIIIVLRSKYTRAQYPPSLQDERHFLFSTSRRLNGSACSDRLSNWLWKPNANFLLFVLNLPHVYSTCAKIDIMIPVAVGALVSVFATCRAFGWVVLQSFWEGPADYQIPSERQMQKSKKRWKITSLPPNVIQVIQVLHFFLLTT